MILEGTVNVRDVPSHSRREVGYTSSYGGRHSTSLGETSSKGFPPFQDPKIPSIYAKSDPVVDVKPLSLSVAHIYVSDLADVVVRAKFSHVSTSASAPGPSSPFGG